MKKLLKEFNKNPMPYWCYLLAFIVGVYGTIDKPYGMGILVYLAVIVTLLCAGSAINRCIGWKCSKAKMFSDDVY